MYNSALAIAAFAATAAAYGAVGSSSIAPGTAKVVNGCDYDVYLSNVPASGGGYDSIDKTLASGETYTQTYTQLSNLMGWSIKLSKDGNFGSNILQYEYTYLTQDNIWYDLSEVDGNPWDGNWEITANNGEDCSPRQAAYRFATDDAYGMQDCPANSDITVLVCSGESQADGVAASVEASAAGSSTAAPESTPAYSAEPEPTSWEHSRPTSSFEINFHQADAQDEPTSTPTSAPESTPSPTPTTQATTLITKAAEAPAGVIVTEFATAVVTELVTMTHYAHEEHGHHHGRKHPHARA